VDELKNADEVMILSTGTHCVGACELDGKPLGGKDPALLDKLQKAYQQWFDEETAK
jgi:D-alanine transaminase